MPHTWERALQKYKYPDPEKLPLDLSTFMDAADYSGWFQYNDSPVACDLEATKKFEDRFRELAPHYLEAWYEVVFWKMYSQPRSRNRITKHVIKEITSDEITSNILHALCRWYTNSDNPFGFSGHEMFRVFRRMLIINDVVATAAIFPAFLDPDNFPMVDTQVARWSKANGAQHSYAPNGPDLSNAPTLGKGKVLTDSHWPFVESWIDWCRHTRDILNKRTERKWRARDVEMAVFTAQKYHLPLKPLSH